MRVFKYRRLYSPLLITFTFFFFEEPFWEVVGLEQGPLSLVNTTNKHTPWPQSSSELYWPSDRGLLAKLIPTFADRGCLVVSMTGPYGRILGFPDRSRYFFFQGAPQLYSRGWVDPVPDPLLLRKFGSVGNRTRTYPELLGRKSSGCGLENRIYHRRDPLCWPRATPSIRKSRHKLRRQRLSLGRYSSLAEFFFPVRTCSYLSGPIYYSESFCDFPY
jgi:hypothetical protein